MSKAIIYCRKSTDDREKQQQSLGTQLDWCENYASTNQINVIDTIVVSESAKDVGREGFSKLMSQIENGTANVIICMYFDRLSRNPRDSARIQELLQKGKINRIITSTRIFTVEDSGLLFSVESGFANEYILKIKKGVRDGFMAKMKAGGYYSKAPLGYLNDRLNKTIIIDKERSHYIPRMFEMRAEGCSAELIRDVLYQEGLRSSKTGKKVAKGTIEACLHNPFYYGWIRYNGEMFDKGELYKGNHTPLISKELFDKVQKITRGVKYIHDRDLTPLNGKVYYKKTGQLISPALVKKKYVYFQVRDGEKQIWFSQNEIISYFDKIIELYRIPDEYKEEIKNLLQDEYNKEIGNNAHNIGTNKTMIAEKEYNKQNLILMRGRGEITGEELVTIKNNLNEEIENLNQKIIDLSQKNDLLISDFNNLVELLFTCIDKRKTLDNKKKVLLINEIVVELFFDEEKRLYIKENPIYKALKSSNYSVWSYGANKRGKIEILLNAIIENGPKIPNMIRNLKRLALQFC